jgi:hypothetical protein
MEFCVELYFGDTGIQKSCSGTEPSSKIGALISLRNLWVSFSKIKAAQVQLFHPRQQNPLSLKKGEE